MKKRGLHKMKKIKLLAYTNYNFGDDMFIKTICNYFPQEKFEIVAPRKYKVVFKDIKNLHVISLGKIGKRIANIFSILESKCGLLEIKHLYRYKAVVYVIGGLFDEDDLWHASIDDIGIEKQKIVMWRFSFTKSVPFYLLGCNMTRIKTQQYIDEMTYLFEGLEDVCFRDKYSYSYFKRMGNVRYAPDIVFNYYVNPVKQDDKLILISVWGPLLRCEKLKQWKWAEQLWIPYRNFILKIIDFFASQHKEIHLLALCEDEGDLLASEKIYEESMHKDRLVIDKYDGNLNDVISLFARANFIVGSRFHSVVMAINCGICFYPIAYESKTVQLLNDIRYSDHYSHIEDEKSYNIDYVKTNYFKRSIIETKIIKEEASKQFSHLNNYLRNYNKTHRK